MFAVLSAARKTFARLSLLISVLWIASCDTLPAVNTGGGSLFSGSVPVALLVPHGAASDQEQKLARDLENAARLAVSDLQGVKIDLRVYSTAGNAARAQAAALEAVNDGARIIVGPLHAESANAVAVAVADKGVNVLSFSNNATIAGGNLFILGQTFQTTANRLARYATQNGKDKVLTVYSDNLAGQLGKQAIQQAVRASGGTNAGSVSYEFSQDGVVNAVPQITAAAEANGANSIFLTANTAGALPLFSQMLPEAGLSPENVQYIGLSRWDTPRQTLSLPGVQGGWFALPDPSRAAQYNSRFSTSFGTPPHALSGLAYDGIAAIGALAQSRGRDALSRGALTQAAGFQGVTGIFRFLPDGTNDRGLAVATIVNNQVSVVSPAPQGFGAPGF
ncbi:penicillin-binding protein activator [Roseovarius aestuarii]|uniref:Receptor family ligand binding region n=1 Tax=Roseovarius aestuarii TaxID=475083 RepID=A0A1X7BP88_9RHOB|nr:penicillin-binding protein activator [Roseovarius aestuarii]SMC11443.1 Receptor family ligand binding region [Roseovarius aestuarii]